MNHVDVIHFIKWLTDFMEKVQCSFCHGQSGFRAKGRKCPIQTEKAKHNSNSKQQKVLLQLYMNTVAVILVLAAACSCSVIVVQQKRKKKKDTGVKQ